jgi:hypothetical protein
MEDSLFSRALAKQDSSVIPGKLRLNAFSSIPIKSKACEKVEELLEKRKETRMRITLIEILAS